MTSTYQTAVLVQYNHNDTMSLDELVAATALPKETLLQILAVLVKAKILVNEEPEQYDLNPGMFSTTSELLRMSIIYSLYRLQVQENSSES